MSAVFVVDSVLDFSFEGSGVPSLSVLFLDEKSKPAPLPGVFGVFAEEPKDAKAPDPRPKADDAADGELVDGVVMELKGLFLPWDEESPNRRLVYVRGESDFPSLSVPLIERESLLLLMFTISVSLESDSGYLLRPPRPQVCIFHGEEYKVLMEMYGGSDRTISKMNSTIYSECRARLPRALRKTEKGTQDDGAVNKRCLLAHKKLG